MADEKGLYLATIARMEPDICGIDPTAFYASAAVSLKRIADAAEQIAARLPPLGPVTLDRGVLTDSQLRQISVAIGRPIISASVVEELKDRAPNR